MNKQWIKAWLDSHNAVRASVRDAVPALPKVVWSEDLSKQARLWVSGCKFAHNTCRNTPEFKFVGENMSMSSTSLSSFQLTPEYVSSVVAGWANERSLAGCAPSKINPYNMEDHSAGCGHYTQIVRRKAKAIGCAAVLFPDRGMKTILAVCQYSYGNMLDENVY